MLIGILKNALGISKNKSVKILMYHHVMPKNVCNTDNLYVTLENLDQQFSHIKEHYTTVFFRDLENNKGIENKLIITFDDGYFDNLEYLIPLLKKHQLKATLFIPTHLIKENEREEEKKFMNFEEIKSLPSDCIEIALHSHTHRNLSEISIEEAEKDLLDNMKFLEQNQIQFTKVLAYPYGRFPRKQPEKKIFFQMLEKIGIQSALRIGNTLESYPWKNKYEINRIDIQYKDDFSRFKWKLRLGKLKL
ncbi:polysaccharide deacetylase family protein [Chryseobacterium sp.]|uniref:polysaccharide deacetylase family protein n=1 Tax=Chryseobacterium sp. TaxID=1871047 RepID=UPI00388F3551